jgi:hypothetical protein
MSYVVEPHEGIYVGADEDVIVVAVGEEAVCIPAEDALDVALAIIQAYYTGGEEEYEHE